MKYDIVSVRSTRRCLYRPQALRNVEGREVLRYLARRSARHHSYQHGFGRDHEQVYRPPKGHIPRGREGPGDGPYRSPFISQREQHAESRRQGGQQPPP